MKKFFFFHNFDNDKEKIKEKLNKYNKRFIKPILEKKNKNCFENERYF